MFVCLILAVLVQKSAPNLTGFCLSVRVRDINASLSLGLLYMALHGTTVTSNNNDLCSLLIFLEKPPNQVIETNIIH